MAGDELGDAFIYNGSSWRSAGSSDCNNNFCSPNSLSSLSCTSPTFCAGVTPPWWVSIEASTVYLVNPYGLTYNGTGWNTPQLLDYQFIVPNSVSCADPSFCVAVDNSGDYFLYDGTSWASSVNIDGTTSLNSVSCPSSSFCVAVDATGNALTYDGTSWTAPTDIDGSADLVSVSCATTTSCVAVDATGNALTYNGSSWSTPTDIDPGQTLEQVSCPTTAFCVAIDSAGNAVTLNGSSWSVPVSIDPSLGTPASVSCPTSSFCVLVDTSGNAFVWDGSSWSSPDLLARTSLTVSCASPTFCVAAGENGDVYTYDGSSWSVGSDIDGTTGLYDVSCPTSTFCVATDYNGAVVVYQNGSWGTPTSLDPAEWLYVSCASSTFCVAVGGADGNAYSFNGSSWSTAQSVGISGSGWDVSAVSCTSTVCVAVGDDQAAIYSGGSWSSPVTIGDSPDSISCSSVTFCLAVDIDGGYATYDGSSWSSVTSFDPAAALYAMREFGPTAVSCPTAQFCTAVDSLGNVLTYWGTGTLIQATPTSASVADGAGYSGQLNVTDGVGTVSYTETASTDSADVVVNSTGVISAATSLTPGTYTVGGGDSDTNGDTGTWSFALTVNPAVVTPPPPPPSGPPSSSSPPSPPSPPAGVTSSQNCSSSSSSGTCTATNDATTASGSGEGAVTVSQYSSDPVASPTFSTPGEYFDVQVASGSSFSSLTITDCNLNGATGLEWWNGGAWEPVTPTPDYGAGPPACLSVTIDSTSSPTLSELTGTVFAVSGLATVPGAPTKVSAKAGNASATVTWTAPSSDGGAAITGYVIKPSKGSAVRVGDVTSDIVTGLSNGTAYSFTVAAVNAIGTGPSSAVSNSVIPAKASSEIALKLSAKKLTYGNEQTERISVAVSPQHSGAMATGTVTIKTSATTLCVIKLSSGKGWWTMSAKKLKPGTYHLVATYSGSKNFKGSTSAKETLIVVK
jgi:hypothetical protein